MSTYFKGIGLLLALFFFFSFSSQSIYSRSAKIFTEAKIRVDADGKTPLEIRFPEGKGISVTSFFVEYQRNYRLSDDNQLKSSGVFTDQIGQTHHRMMQTYKGLELAEVQYLLHEKDDVVFYAHGKLIHDLDLDVIPSLSESQALVYALKRINAESYIWENNKFNQSLTKEQYDLKAAFYPKGELKISCSLKERVTDNFRLVYRFDIFAEKPLGRYYVDVDAKTGEIVGVLSRLHPDDVPGLGTSLYNDEVSIVVSDSNFYIPPVSPHWHIDEWNAFGGTGKSWWMADPTFGNQGGYGDVWYEVLDTGPVNLNGENLALSFNHRYSVETPSPYGNYDAWDGMNIRISVNNGETWQILEDPVPAYTHTNLYSFGNIHGEGEGIPGWAGQLNEWTDVTCDLSAYVGKTIHIRFAFASDGAASTLSSGDPDWFGWQIDNIVLSSSAETLWTNTGVDSGFTATNLIQEAMIIAGKYRLREQERSGGIVTFDARNQTGLGLSVDFVDSDSNFTDANALAGVSTHWATEVTYDYYITQHGRNSFDDNGGRIVSYTHYDTDYNNAFWAGGFMFFGDGDGSTFGPLVSLDVVGHEFTHGVTEFSADLIYANESGALNESFSDIFGTAIEFFVEGAEGDWLLGEDFILPASYLRSMENPKSKNNPDTYLGQFWIPYTDNPNEENDLGGVHTNSGVQNHWFYLLSEGGTGINDNNDAFSVNGIGIEDAAKIAYRNLTVYLTPTSGHKEARLGAMNAAIDLFGLNSPQLQSVMDAWYAVGVYIPFIGPYAQNAVINSNYQTPETDTLQMTSKIFNPQDHILQVSSIIESFDGSISDTTHLFDDGAHSDSSTSDNIFGGSWPVRAGERSYNIHIKTLSLDSGYFNIFYDAAQFITIGPVVFDSYLVTSQFENIVVLKLFLTNIGQNTTANEITVELTTTDTANVASIVTPTYIPINIPAGETVLTYQYFGVELKGSAEEIPFNINISSNSYHFWTDSFTINLIDAIDKLDSNIPKEFTLHQNYPNPFNPKTTINYQLPITNYVDLSIYNILGEKVAMLVSERQDAGYHQVEWDATGFASGVYLYRILTGIGYTETKKLVLLK